MQQQLNVQLTIPIPADQVLISKVELEELQRNQLVGLFWTMKDLEQRTGRGRTWIQDYILYNPKFKKLLDVENGGFVYYPQGKGYNWSFQASKMAQFLDNNFHLIWGQGG